MAYSEKIIRRAFEIRVKDGCSASSVLRILEKEFPEDVGPLNVKTINRWFKTRLDLSPESSIKIDTDIKNTYSFACQNWKEHFEQLSNVAKDLLVDDLVSILDHSAQTDETYSLFNSEDLIYHVDKEELSYRIDNNLQLAYVKYKDWFINRCFIPHLEAELPKEIKDKGLWDGVIDHYPYELINMLRILAFRKTFKGTCPVCKDWAK